MQYVMIENKGEIPIIGLTILGASDAEGSKIGMFGTGCKCSIALLLRKGVDFVIYSGLKKIEFYTRPEILNNKVVDIICFRVTEGSKVEEKDTGFSLHFGEHDWTSVDMAMREFISNAIDQNKEICNLQIKEPEAKAGSTRVFIEFTKEIRQYIDNIDKYFLHFRYCEDKQVIKHSEDRGPRIYRRGVFVRELPKFETPSEYDYNFEDMPIDECRNLNNDEAKANIGRLIARNEDLWVDFVTKLSRDEKCWEINNIHSWDFGYSNNWEKRWQENFGNTVIASNANEYNYAIKKGQTPILMEEWFLAFKSAKVPVVDFKPLNIEKYGYSISEPASLLEHNFDVVWDKLQNMNLTRSKPKPKLQMFEGGVEGETVLAGECRDNIVYINKNNMTDFSTILEEIGHYVTGASDMSRDFQSYAFEVAAKFMEKN